MTIRIGFTGHRKLENPAEVANQIRNSIREILDKSGATKFQAVTCIASGGDSIFADVALEMGGDLKIVMPMPADDYLDDFEGGDVAIFKKLVSNDRTPTLITDRKPLSTEERNDLYLRAGEKVVDNCDYLIAVWDGEKSKGKGGTGNIVAYGKAKGVDVIHIRAFKSDISRLFTLYDKKAVRHKSVYEWLWKLSIIFSLSSALILAASISFELDSYRSTLAIFEFVTVSVSICIILYLKYGQLNKKRIEYRRVAERLRVLEDFDNSQVNIEQLEQFSGLPDEVEMVEKKYQAIAYNQTNFFKSRKSLLYLVEEQIQYHTVSRPELNGTTFHLLENTLFPLLIIFSVGVSLHLGSVLIEDSHLSHLLHEVGLMLSLSIPPAYAAIEGFIYFKEYHKISLDSEKMKASLRNIKLSIGNIDALSEKNFDELNSFAFQVMKIMDAETKEWGIIVGQKKAPGI